MADSNINLPSTDPFADLDKHQEILDKLESAIDSITNTSNKATSVMSSLSTHNISPEAHADIRALIDNINVSTEQVSLKQVSNHNESDTAHPDIRSLINDTNRSLDLVREGVDDKVAAHNDSTQAHIDIRQKIEELKMLTKEDNSAEISEELTKLNTTSESLSTDVSSLQNENATQNLSIANLMVELSTLNTKVLNTGITSDVESILATIQDLIDSLNNQLVSSQHDLTVVRSSTGSVSSLDFTNFKCNGLPTRLGRSQQASISFTGVNAVTDGQQIRYSIVSKDEALSFSASTNLTSSTTVTVTMSATATPNTQMLFVARATNTTTNEYIEKTFALMSVADITPSQLGISGLPDSLEPGTTYNIHITNTADKGDGRFSYRIEQLTSGISFSSVTVASTSSTITMQVAASAPRNTDFQFLVTANDTQANAVSKTFTIHTNPIVDTTGFSHNVPQVLVPGKQYIVRFSGIPGTNNTLPTYSIDNTNLDIAFSKTVNIVAGENISMMLANTATRGDAYSFNVHTKDKYNATSDNTVGFTVNQLPIADNLLVVTPSSSEGGTDVTCSISGGTDPNGGALTYRIEAEEGSLSFSKMVNIAANESIKITLPKVKSNITKTFKVYAVDSLGETSVTFTTVNITVTPIYVTAPPTITSPISGVTIEPPFTITWTDYSTYVDLS